MSNFKTEDEARRYWIGYLWDCVEKSKALLEARHLQTYRFQLQEITQAQAELMALEKPKMQKRKLEIELSSCRECPFFDEEFYMGRRKADWSCRNVSVGCGYKPIDLPDAIPDWCPLEVVSPDPTNLSQNLGLFG